MAVREAWLSQLVSKLTLTQPRVTAARSPPAWTVSSGSSTACWPASRGTVLHVGGRGDVDMLVQQRRDARRAVGHAAFDLGEAVEAIPEHLPLLLLEATIGFGVVEDVDLVVVTRAPEQPRRLIAHHVPDRAAQALALRVVEYGELVQVGRIAAVGQYHRGTIVFADVGTQQRRALEIVRHQAAPEARLDELTQAVQVELVPRGSAQHLLAPAHQRS